MSLKITSSIAGPASNPTDVPDAFTSGQWSVADAQSGGDAVVTVTELPTINAAWIDVLQYDLDGAGSWTPIPGSSGSNATGDFTLSGVFTDGVATDIRIRVVNSDGPSLASDTKSVTTTAGGAYVSPTLTNATSSANGARSFNASVTTNKSGTLYVYVSQNASETEGTITSSGDAQTVSEAGSVPFSGIGILSPSTTYYVHLAFTDGTNTVTASTSSFTTTAEGTDTGTVTATIARDTAPVCAPYGLMLDVAVSGGTVAQSAANAWDPAFSHYTVITDWDDPGAPSDKVVNVPTQWNNLNTSYGFQPSHVYTTPGSYTATVRVYEPDGTLVGEDTVAITVANPNTTFSGNRTILIDPDGTGDNATYPSSQVFTNFPAAFNAARALNSTCRMLFKRGTTTQLTSAVIPKADVDNFYLGAWGSGNRPVIQLPQSNSITAGSSSNAPGSLFKWEDSGGYTIVFDQIDFQGPWNATTETGGQYNLIRSTKRNASRRVIFNDCLVSGFSTAIRDIPYGSLTTGYWVNNCDITNWGDYGLIFFGAGEEILVSITGTAIHQKRDALMGGGGKDFDINQHGPIRIQAGGRTNIEVVDLFSRNGWTVNTAQPTSQPCTRFFFSTQASPSFYPRCNVSRYAAEGGYACVQIKHQNNGGSGGAINMLMDKVLVVATPCTWHPFEVQWTGWTVRNCMVVVPDVPVRNETWRGLFFAFDLGVSRADNPVEIHNTTIINLKSTSSLDGRPAAIDTTINGTKLATDYTFENNAIYQVGGSPSEAIDVDLSTALPTVGGVWTSRWDGERWKAGSGYAAKLTMDTTNVPSGGYVTTAIPNSGSPLVNDGATGLVAHDDLYGTIRSTADRGAAERS